MTYTGPRSRYHRDWGLHLYAEERMVCGKCKSQVSGQNVMIRVSRGRRYHTCRHCYNVYHKKYRKRKGVKQ